MTRQQAIRTYLNQYRFSDVIIRRLMQWDPKKSVRENSDAMKLNEGVANALRKRFKLGYKRVGYGGNFNGLKGKV